MSTIMNSFQNDMRDVFTIVTKDADFRIFIFSLFKSMQFTLLHKAVHSFDTNLRTCSSNVSLFSCKYPNLLVFVILTS